MNSILKQCFMMLITMIAAVVLIAPPGHAHSLILNGDFAAGGTSWMTAGNVRFGEGYAELFDQEEPYYGTLYQGVEVTPGRSYTYSFTFQPKVEPAGQQGTFSDLFATTLYFGFVNDIWASAEYLPLFDLSGSTFIPGEGNITELANGFSRYYLTFTPQYNWVFPTFDFADDDQVAGGFARVALVQFEEVQSMVPEPSTLLLSLGGAACLWFVRFRKRS